MEKITNNVVELISKTGITGALIAVIIYFGSLFVSSLNDVQKELCSIRLELVKIQSSIISEDKIQKMIDDKIQKVIFKYHK